MKKNISKSRMHTMSASHYEKLAEADRMFEEEISSGGLTNMRAGGMTYEEFCNHLKALMPEAKHDTSVPPQVKK